VEIVYVITVAALASTNFLVFRHGIFHAQPAEAPAVGSDGAVE
jgi:hypothetical protein